MGRPRVYSEPRVATAVRLPSSFREELQELAAQRQVSVNYLVTQAVANYLRHCSAPAGYGEGSAEKPSKKRRGPKKARRDRG